MGRRRRHRRRRNNYGNSSGGFNLGGFSLLHIIMVIFIGSVLVLLFNSSDKVWDFFLPIVVVIGIVWYIARWFLR